MELFKRKKCYVFPTCDTRFEHERAIINRDISWIALRYPSLRVVTLDLLFQGIYTWEVKYGDPKLGDTFVIWTEK
jgi:hypothetical protein